MRTTHTFWTRTSLLAAITLGFLIRADAVTFTNTQAGPNTWIYTLTFAPLDNYSITQGTTTITLTGLVGVTAAAGPTSDDVPNPTGNSTNLNWQAQVMNGGTTVVWRHVGPGTGNYSTPLHVYGFSLTAPGQPSGTVTLATNGFSRDTPNPLPGGGLNLDIGGNVAGPSSASTMVLPQLAFGGGWYSAVYFTNRGSSPLSFPVSFFNDSGNPLTIPGVGASTVMSLPPQGTAILEAPNNANILSQGYVSASLPAGVIVGYGLFRQSVPGIADQEGVVPFSLVSNTSSTLIFDDTNYTTGIAVLNPSAFPTIVSVSVYNTSGGLIGTSSVALAAQNKTEAALRNLPGLAGVAGQRGSAVFTVGTGNVAVLGLRFNGSAFTSIPATGN